jgi:hypothetical protein
MTRGWARRLAVVATALLSGGCSIHGLAFVRDQRVMIESPANYATVSLPVHLHWTGDPPGRFAVFVDTSPMRPGGTLRDLALNDPLCLRTPGCPDQRWLQDHGVYLPIGHSLTLSALQDFGNAHTSDAHQVTVILVDGKGRRIGESAWSVNFFVRRPGGA